MEEQLLDNQPFITDAETIQKFVDAGFEKIAIAESLYSDASRLDARNRVPKFLRPYVKAKKKDLEPQLDGVPERQRRHL